MLVEGRLAATRLWTLSALKGGAASVPHGRWELRQ